VLYAIVVGPRLRRLPTAAGRDRDAGERVAGQAAEPVLKAIDRLIQGTIDVGMAHVA
jgi:hypothetical protein